MNLSKLFEIQNELRDRIGYEGKDKYKKMTLAFIVEVGECANEWRGFKYWSQNQHPKDKTLEEYVDGLHFVLDIGLELKKNRYLVNLPEDFSFSSSGTDVTEHFKRVITGALLLEDRARRHDGGATIERYNELVSSYFTLGVMLGFTTGQIEQAYLEKNKVNYERQNNGY
ncbi:dUTP diphosphatase [Bacillus sp. FJAT-45037]|uniref:dUTP diphosphatase n=1 Tax=Bacillus sp. FJAT-45037 TaxID=2011007 RepID=UPI000C232BD0|nr:dUTP diphosphatase [Bacillus sp. FJAT-45037]